MTTNIPVRDSIGAAMRFVRENWRFVFAVAGIGAVASAALTGLAAAVPQLGLVISVGSWFVQSCIYAVLLGAVLFGAGAVRTRWAANGGRVLASMVVVGFFMTIIMVVISIPVMIALAAGPLAPYAEELQQAGSDETAVMNILMRFIGENPLAVIIVVLFYFTIWILLTSRLYLAAPATVDQNRILSFDTWPWTKGAMLRIAGARLLLLIPANILTGAFGYLVSRAMGFNTLDMTGTAHYMQQNPIGFVAYTLASTFVALALYSSLEAGLSANLYRALKPANVPPPAA